MTLTHAHRTPAVLVTRPRLTLVPALDVLDVINAHADIRPITVMAPASPVSFAEIVADEWDRASLVTLSGPCR